MTPLQSQGKNRKRRHNQESATKQNEAVMHSEKEISRHFGLGLLGILILSAAVLSGCLGGSSSSGGQDVLEPELTMRITTQSGPVAVGQPGTINISCGASPNSRAVEVQIRRDGRGVADLDGTSVQGTLSFTGEGRAVLSRFNDPDDLPVEPENDRCQQALASAPVDLSSGTATFFINGLIAGPVRFRASAVVDGVSLDASRTIEIGRTDGSGRAQQFLLEGPRTISRRGTIAFQLTVVDENGQRVSDPVDVPNINLTFTDGDEFYSDIQFIDADTGQLAETLDLRTRNGQANFAVRAGDGSAGDGREPGVAAMRVRALDGPDAPEFVYGIDVQGTTVGGIPLAILTEADDVPDGVVGSPFLFLLEAEGGIGPRVWRISNGFLPQGIDLEPTGLLSGTPTESGVFPFEAEVSDSDDGSEADRRFFSLEIQADAPLAIVTSSLPQGREGEQYVVALQASGGTGDVTWELLEGRLPNGLSLSSSGIISGTPTESGNFFFVVQASDSDQGTGPERADFNLEIEPASEEEPEEEED